jgi:hypothetical protein
LDYFKQRRAYRNFKMYEASVSNGQNNLYRELLDYANDEGKLDVQFRMKNSALLSLTGLSEPGLDKARNSLVQLGLIKYIKGKKNIKSPEYRIINLYGRSTSRVTDKTDNPTGSPTSNPTRNDKSMPASLEEVGQLVGQGGGQLVGHKELTSTDLDLTKKINKKNLAEPSKPVQRQITPDEFFATEIWPIYPRKMGYGDALEAYKQAITSGLATNEQIIDGIKRYKAYIQVKNIQEGFIKSAEKWLDGQRWHDQYDMTPTTQQGSQQPFKNHEASQEDVQWSSLQGGS